MPIYEYKCMDCGHVFTEKRSIKERDKVTCPKCKSSNVKRKFAIANVKIK